MLHFAITHEEVEEAHFLGAATHRQPGGSNPPVSGRENKIKNILLSNVLVVRDVMQPANHLLSTGRGVRRVQAALQSAQAEKLYLSFYLGQPTVC